MDGLNPEVAQFLQDAGPVIAGTAFGGAVVGVLVGVVVALALHAALTLLGVYAASGRVGTAARILVGLWNVGVTVALLGLGGAALGVHQGAGAALLGHEGTRAALERAGGAGADAVVAVMSLAPELAGVEAPAGAPPPADLVRAVRSGAWALPVAHVRTVADAYAAALRGPDQASVAQALASRVPAVAEPAFVSGVRQAVVFSVASTRAGRTPADAEPRLAPIWARLDAIAAADGVPGTLSHGELVDVAVRDVLLPAGLDRLLAVMMQLVAGFSGLLVVAWAVPGGLFWLARRWQARGGAEKAAA